MDDIVWKDINYGYQISSKKGIRRIEDNGDISIIGTHYRKGTEYVVIIDDNYCTFEYKLHKIFSNIFNINEQPRRNFLTPEIVEDIRKDWKSGNFNQTQLSRKYMVSSSSMHMLIKGKSYMGN